MIQLLGVAVIATGIYAIARKVEVRIVLSLAGLTLALIAGVQQSLAAGIATPMIAVPMQVVRTFVTTFSNEKFVVPICSAMGFAYVLRATECDRHLVELLTRPFARIRILLIPGAVVVGFFVNVPLISQTSTAVAVGTVLVPLMRASRLSSATIAAALVLGSSLGGELLNQAAPELRSVAEILRPTYPDAKAADCVARVHTLVWWHLLVATLVFWLLIWRAERRDTGKSADAAENDSGGKVNLLKAMVPFVPLGILFLASPTIGILKVPVTWLALPEKKAEVDAFDSRLIGAAMLIGVIAAALTTPRTIRQTATTFFEGAGYGFANIIGLIVAASCFGEGIKQVGLNAVLGGFIERNPTWLIPLAAVIPLAFGYISGSGMAATQSLFEFFVGPIASSGADPFHVGAVVALGAAAGRTMSPVSAVNLMSSNMTGSDPFAVSRRVATPMLIGMLLVVVLAMARR